MATGQPKYTAATYPPPPPLDHCLSANHLPAPVLPLSSSAICCCPLRLPLPPTFLPMAAACFTPRLTATPASPLPACLMPPLTYESLAGVRMLHGPPTVVSVCLFSCLLLHPSAGYVSTFTRLWAQGGGGGGAWPANRLKMYVKSQKIIDKENTKEQCLVTKVGTLKSKNKK